MTRVLKSWFPGGGPVTAVVRAIWWSAARMAGGVDAHGEAFMMWYQEWESSCCRVRDGQ